MDLSKSLEFFDPSEVKKAVHIIGCGAVGSTVAELLARLGIEQLHLWDFDTVEPKNIANQMFLAKHIKWDKISALANICLAINPELKIIEHPRGYKDEALSGYVFLCVDNIDLRREIVTKQFRNPNIVAMYDFRMRLTDAQHYATLWNDEELKKNFLASMQFSHDEAKAETEVSACGTELSVAYTVRILCSLGVINFVNTVKNRELKKAMFIDLKNFNFDIF